MFAIDRMPVNSTDLIREFLFEYAGVLSRDKPRMWFEGIERFQNTPSLLTTYPIADWPSGYKEWKGDSSFRTMASKNFDLAVKRYVDGYSVDAARVFTCPMTQQYWAGVPNQLATSEEVHRLHCVVDMLENATSTIGWDGVPFFSTQHPAGFITGDGPKWSNYQPVPTPANSIANINKERTLMSTLPDMGGGFREINPDLVLLHPHQYYKVEALLAQNYISPPVDPNNPGGGGGTQSQFISGMRVVKCTGLTNPDRWYLVDSSICRTLPPWITNKWQAPSNLSIQWYDEASELFRDTLHYAVRCNIWYAFGLAFPHGIRAIEGA
ncbi:MAG: Mu-like prophage major head subunit gpT family protein [Polyangiaceae bacterium]|nr:Mu-like prophage major head subunit gpT family protein [Polyangiaceae bacterium]